jgi:hypothetical protein
LKLAEVRFGAHNGRKSDVAPNLKSATSGRCRSGAACTKITRQDLWLVVEAFFFYVLLVIDLAIWSAKKLIPFRANAQSR